MHIKPHIPTNSRNFKTPLSPINRTNRQKFNNEIRKITDVMTQMDLTNIHRTFHANTKEYTFFSAYHGIFSKTIYSITKQRATNTKRWNNPCIISDHHGLKLEFKTTLIAEAYKLLEIEQYSVESLLGQGKK